MAERAPVTDRWQQLRLSRKRGLPFEDSGERGPNGCLLCARCGTEIPKGAQKYCSAECREIAPFYQGVTEIVREFAWRRSAGACAGCGVRLRPGWWIHGRNIRHQIATWRNHKADVKHYTQRDGPEAVEEYGFDRTTRRLLGELRQVPPRLRKRCRTYGGEHDPAELVDWDAHHVTPLSEGGWHEPENVVAICKECHKQETSALAGRLAEARRGPDPQTAMKLEGS